MLRFYHRLARRLYPARLAVWALCLAAVAAFAATLFTAGGGRDELYMLGSVTVFLWTLGALVTTYIFVAPLPSAGPEAGLVARVKAAAKRGFLWLLAVVMTALTGLVVFVSARALGMAFRAFGS